MDKKALVRRASTIAPYLRYPFGLAVILSLAIFVVIPRLGQLQDAFSGAVTNQSLPLFLLLMAGLAGINWGLESEKWYRMVGLETGIGRLQAFRSVLIGTAASMISPARTGDILGRALTLPKHKKLAVHAGIMGSMAQLLVTLVLGTLAAFFLYAQNLKLQNGLLLVALTAGAAGTLVIALAYFTRVRIPRIERYLKKFRIGQQSPVLSGKLKGKLLGLSLGRYFIFSLQFLLALSFFGTPLHPAFSISAIGLTYLIMAIMPAIILGELGIRESVVMVVFSTLTQNWEVAILASLLVWLVNLAVPSLIGAILIWKSDRK